MMPDSVQGWPSEQKSSRSGKAALIVTDPDSFAALAGSRVDPGVRVGAKVGGGLNWRLGKDTTLFGAYGFTTDSPNGLLTDSPRTRGDAGSTGFDLMYGHGSVQLPALAGR